MVTKDCCIFVGLIFVGMPLYSASCAPFMGAAFGCTDINVVVSASYRIFAYQRVGASAGLPRLAFTIIAAQAGAGNLSSILSTAASHNRPRVKIPSTPLQNNAVQGRRGRLRVSYRPLKQPHA